MSAAPASPAQEEVFAAATTCFADLRAFLAGPDGRQMDHAALEAALNERGRELLRRLFQANVDLRGDGAAAGPVVGADGTARDGSRLHGRILSTIFGEVRVNRLGYGAKGVASLHPLDAALNLPPKEYSFGVRHIAAEQASQVSFSATLESLAERTGKHMGKRQVEELAQDAATDFDEFYAQRNPEPGEGSPIMVISVDGKGVVMLPRDLREPTRKAAQNQSHKLAKRLCKGEKRNRKRMATAAAVYTVAPYERTPEQMARSHAPWNEPAPPRPPVENKRMWASLEKTPEEVVGDAFQEALRRDPERKKTWVGLVDGNATQISLLKKSACKNCVEMTIILDIIHVSEYLWSASLVFNKAESPRREEWVGERLNSILHGKVSVVAAGMRRSATLRKLTDDQRKPVDAAATYLLNHKKYMRYDQYLKAGLPIATGVIEGVCRHLICDRMDGVARWSLKGADAVLALRALRTSGDFEEYWRYHVEKEYQRNHVARYADGNVIPIRGWSNPELRTVN
jgi:hypothetical protein